MRAAIADIRELTAGKEDAFKADRHTQQAVAYNLRCSAKLRDRYRLNSVIGIPTCPGST
ncbi:MAG: hypothetical protein ACTHMY_06290 [Solirubrobacteraceae bacterium]